MKQQQQNIKMMLIFFPQESLRRFFPGAPDLFVDFMNRQIERKRERERALVILFMP